MIDEDTVMTKPLGVLVYDDDPCRHGFLRRLVGRIIPRLHRHHYLFGYLGDPKSTGGRFTIAWTARGIFRHDEGDDE